MPARSLIVYVLLLLSLPAALLLVAEQIRPPAFVWRQDPIVLLISRTPVALFPGTTRVEALNDRLNASYKDGASLTLVYLGDTSAAELELAKQVREVREAGLELSGSAPDFQYRADQPGGRPGHLGRIVRAENTVVHVTALSESSLRFHFLGVPLLVDQSDQSLGGQWLRNHRLASICCLIAYLALGGLLGARIFGTGRHGRRSGLPE